MITSLTKLVGQLGVGMSPEAVLEDHPRRTPDDIRAAQAFAAGYLTDERL
jgi:uncharacterized protein (DUF433 family)